MDLWRDLPKSGLRKSFLLRITVWTGYYIFSSGKDLWIYGQNTQIAKYIVGGLKNPYIFTNIQYFLDIFSWNYFSMHIKAEGMTKFDIFPVFVENSVNSDLCFFWALLKPAKIWNLSKNAHVWAT